MRLYNRNMMNRRLEHHRKSWVVNDRDAIIWSIDTNNYYALVKIQGSNTTIKAHYPRNWKTIPTWLKKGNAVRVRHRSGDQGFVEIVGNGRAIPTPVEGGSLPTADTPDDAVVTGMAVKEHSGGGMNIYVEDGTYRVDGSLYAYTATVTGYIVMDDPAPIVMGSADVLGYGDTITAIPISAAPSAGYGRYDTICIGTDGTIDVLEGTPSVLSSEPAKRSVPTDHVLIGYLFLYGGMTSIPQNWIGVTWTAPAPSSLTLTSDMENADGELEFEWDSGDDYPVESVTFSIADQYGQNYSVSAATTLELMFGTGGVGTSAGGSFSSSASKSMSHTVTYYYQRDQTETPEILPLIKLSITGHPSLAYPVPIMLLDVSGDPI